MGVFNDRLLFIHIPKTAGTALKTWLWKHLPDPQGQRPATPEGNYDTSGLPIGHVPLRDIERFTGRSPDSFERIVGVIRDPYAQQLSQYLFWRDRYAQGGRHPHDLCAAANPDMTTWLSSPECDFHRWYEPRFGPADDVERRGELEAGPDNFYEGFPGYYHYWLSVGGTIPDNVHVVRLGKLTRGWPTAMTGFVENPAAPVPRANQGPGRGGPVRNYYHDEKARKLIRAKFRWAFKHHYSVIQ